MGLPRAGWAGRSRQQLAAGTAPGGCSLGLLFGLLFGLLMSAPCCTWLPSEFNLAPLFRQRLDEDGRLLELDVLWPIIHYELTPEGGSDFRIRPLYRRVEKPDLVPGARATDHQFLWPLGRVRHNQDEVSARIWPLWNYKERASADGGRESDWYFLFPFVWGGSGHGEDYLGVFPFYLDAPQFLTYDRFTTVLWPLYLRTEKDQRVGHIFLWPLLGFGYSAAEDGTRWHRVLPLYNFIAHPGRFARYAILWPFLNWSWENLDSDDPMFSYALWPLFARQRSESGRRSGWSFLWPFFQSRRIGEDYRRLDILWPFYRYERDQRNDKDFLQWWLWPFVSRTLSPKHRAWSALWPLIWWREYRDPEGKQTQLWVLPFYWWVHREHRDGGEDDFLKIWPFWHRECRRDGTGEWSLLSLWPYAQGNAEGVDEAFGWLWTLARHRTRAPQDEAFHLAGHLYSTRRRGNRVQTSVPFLFNYESDGSESTLRLLQFIPLRIGGAGKASEASQPSKQAR